VVHIERCRLLGSEQEDEAGLGVEKDGLGSHGVRLGPIDGTVRLVVLHFSRLK
jgi:hypothetical protein